MPAVCADAEEVAKALAADTAANGAAANLRPFRLASIIRVVVLSQRTHFSRKNNDQ